MTTTTATTSPPAQEAEERLRTLVQPGDTLYTVLRHVSRSGMSRRLHVYVVRAGEMRLLTPAVAALLGLREDIADGAIVMRGSGMDFGAALVRDLSAALYGDPYSLSQRWL